MKRTTAQTIDDEVASSTKPARKPLKVCGAEFCYLGLVGIIYANIGWWAENTVKLIAQGVVDCRYHILPFISPYALVPFACQIVFGDPDRLTVFGRKIFKKDCLRNRVFSNLICAFTCVIAVFAGELAAGNLWELCFGAKLWNYSNIPLNVTQYAGLIPSLGYGLGAYLLFRLVHKPLLSLFRRKVKYSAAKWIFWIFVALLFSDDSAMVIQTAILHSPPMYWSVKLW